MTENTETFSHDRSGSLRFLLVLLAFILGGMLVANVLTGFIWMVSGIDLNEIFNGDDLTKIERNIFRLGLIINHAGTFLIPALLFYKYFLKENRIHYLGLNNSFKFEQVILWGLAIICSYPVIAQLTLWNTLIPLPDWMTNSQSNAFALLEQTLKMEGVGELLISILLVGIFAAVGEELIFRGLVQKHLLHKYKNPHIAILLAAIIFGGFHMQFERIIPLSLLGLLLGYSYYYSRSLLIPIVLHFLNNSFQIISIYVVTRNDEMPDINAIPELPLTLVVASLITTILFVLWAAKSAPIFDESRS